MAGHAHPSSTGPGHSDPGLHLGHRAGGHTVGSGSLSIRMGRRPGLGELAGPGGLPKDGKIIETGDADEIYFNPQTEYTKTLIESIPAGI